MVIKIIELESFEELRDYIENDIGDVSKFVFRGQADETWKLNSTLNRLILHARATGTKNGSIDSFVRKHLRRFKLEIRGRRGDNPSKLKEDDLWSLGQHYGLATPLLDWSRSPYIALFFALIDVNNLDEKRALWCMNENMVKRLNYNLQAKDKLTLIFPDTNDNKRLLSQSGLFSKGPVMESVDDWIINRGENNGNSAMIKIVFPGDLDFRKIALKKLNLMNINYSTIMPDLIGASNYCNILAEDYV